MDEAIPYETSFLDGLLGTVRGGLDIYREFNPPKPAPVPPVTPRPGLGGLAVNGPWYSQPVVLIGGALVLVVVAWAFLWPRGGK